VKWVSNADMRRLASVACVPRRAMLRVVVLVGVMCVPIGRPHAHQNVPPSEPVQDDSDIAAVFGNAADAATFMPVIVKGLEGSNGRVFVLSRQIRVEWLPSVEGVEFVRLSDAEAVTLSSACGDYWVISVAKDRDNGDLWVTTRRRCRASSSGMAFALRDGEWRDTGRRGTGSGWYIGPPPECLACLQR
jgi:hypothetical protein